MGQLYVIDITRQSEYLGQGYLDRAQVLQYLFANEVPNPGESFTYGFDRPWIIEHVTEVTHTRKAIVKETTAK